MSGHSKWHNIQATKGKADAARSKIFTKIGREIAVAVKLGGPDPSTNSKLATVILKAKQMNMPNDNIDRSIKKASGELSGVNYEACTYEGYGVGGSAVIVECLTDNKNRTAGDVRHAFDKYNGSLGSTGCVSYLFSRKGVIVVPRKEGITHSGRPVFSCQTLTRRRSLVMGIGCIGLYHVLPSARVTLKLRMAKKEMDGPLKENFVLFPLGESFTV